MKNLLRGWNPMRVLRLAVGIMAIGQAISLKEWLPAIAGIFLLYTAIANVGCCCGSGGCAVPPRRDDDIPDEQGPGKN